MTWRKGNKLKLVAEADAPPRVAEAYQQIKQALGLPQVGELHQAFAAYPAFFDLHWRAFRPLLLSADFFRLADRLRADAYTRVFNYLEVPDLAGAAGPEEKQREATALLDLLQYKNPLLLLIAAAQFQAFETPIGGSGQVLDAPVEHPVFTESPILVGEPKALPEVRQCHDEIRRSLALPFVSYDYRALARFPQFLSTFWTAVKKVRNSGMYEGAQYAIRETAWALTRELPFPIELTVAQMAEAGISDEDIASIVGITEVFVNVLSGLVLTANIGRIGLEGGTRPPASAPSEPAKPKDGRAA